MRFNVPEEIKDDGDNGVTVSEKYNGKEGDQWSGFK